jgi:hypothetical protein
MFLKVILISIVLLALAGIALAVKYYKAKRLPLCSSNNSKIAGTCIDCGSETTQDCIKKQENHEISN